jgi:protein-tyrosine phosphatase
LCSSKQIEFINFPIPDRDIPLNNDKTDKLIDNLIIKIDKGNSIVIHCRMGIGRSSIIAAAILLKYGFSVDEIMDKISIIRGMKVPDTDQQLDWLRQR